MVKIPNNKFPDRCPECGASSESCHWSTIETDGQTWATQEGNCNRCYATWEEMYLASHIDITRPAQRWANGAVKFETHEDDEE